jgi:hypothetical protein
LVPVPVPVIVGVPVLDEDAHTEGVIEGVCVTVGLRLGLASATWAAATVSATADNEVTAPAA